MNQKTLGLQEGLKKSNNMKKFIVMLSIVYGFLSCHKNDKLGNDEIRQAGYLIIETSMSEIIKSDTIKTAFDQPKKYFFKTKQEMRGILKETLKTLEEEKGVSLYLPIGLTGSNLDIDEAKISFNEVLKKKIDISILPENKEFRESKRTIVRVKGDNVLKRVYEIIYIDGIWKKVKVPYKWVNVLRIGNYNSNNLDTTEKEGYTYCFLKKIDTIKYNLNFNTEGIEILNQVEK